MNIITKLALGITLFSFVNTTFANTSLAQFTMEQGEDLSVDYKKADKELNVAYQNLMKLISPQEKIKLVEAQKLWIKFRDAECSFQGMEYKGGSFESMTVIMCKTKLTEQRTKDLKELVNDKQNK